MHIETSCTIIIMRAQYAPCTTIRDIGIGNGRYTDSDHIGRRRPAHLVDIALALSGLLHKAALWRMALWHCGLMDMALWP